MKEKVFAPALLAVLSNRFEGINRQMVNTLLRSARSGGLNMGRDFSTAIVTADGRLFFSGEGLPIHVVGIEFVARAMTEFFDDLREGDAFIHNSPYHGNTHHADHVIIVPVFYEGKHVFTSLAKAHQADTGNSLPTTYMPNAKDIFEEGSLNFPCVRIQENYRDKEDIIRMCRMRIRVPDQWYGDYLAMLGAARIGERRCIELLDKYGGETVEEFKGAWFAYSERRMVEEIRGLPKGTWEGENRHDPVLCAPDGIPVKVRISVDPEKAFITVDLRDNIDCIKGGMNLSSTCAIASVMVGIFNILDSTIPHNDGSFKRIKVLLRENCIVGIPLHPASCSVATTDVADRLVNVVQTTFSETGKGQGMAEGGLGLHAGAAVISGRDPRKNNEPFINHLTLIGTGGPGVNGQKGWLNYCNPVSAGLMYRDSLEVDEQKYPIIVYERGLVTDSEGAGKYRGAPTGKAVYGPAFNEPVTAIYLSDGHFFPARGVLGGREGGPSDVWKIDAKGRKIKLPHISAEVLQPGEKIVGICCGGGGYGDPLESDPEWVREDIREGLISPKKGKQVYGVELETKTEQYEVDYAATEKLRNELRKSEKR